MGENEKAGNAYSSEGVGGKGIFSLKVFYA